MTLPRGAIKRAKIISKILEDLFPNPQPPLDSVNDYTFLIAVLLSAQCTDLRVNKITPALFEKASTPKQMLELGFDRIYEIIKPCGLAARKAQAILDLSQVIVEKFDGQIPSILEQLEQLPGVGRKTASVVISQVFHLPAFAVDTHILRCAKRWKLSHSQRPEGVERDLKRCFDESTWSARHLQIIFYARAFCQARAHNIQKCIICQKLGINSDF